MSKEKQNVRPRFGKGFSKASAFVRGDIQKASESRGFSQSRLLTHWADIAGQEIAKIARPVKVSYAKSGLGATLVLLSKGAHAPMVQMQIPDIMKRVNSIYGYNAISRIQVTQTAAEGLFEPSSAFEHNKESVPNNAATKQAEQLASDIEDEDLRNALTRLGSHVISK